MHIIIFGFNRVPPVERLEGFKKKKEVMKTKDFEQAIEALGAQGLEILKFSYQLNGGVAAVFARIGEYTFLKWNAYGRGFCFDVEQEPGSDGKSALVEVEHPEYLDYRRDSDFDLKFE